MRIAIALTALTLFATTANAQTTLTGAGSTFAFPLYSKWSSEFGKSHAGARVNYQSIGSGGGVKQISERTVDFGATDSPMTDDELKKAAGVLHVPTALGAVVVVYNGMPDGVRLGADLLADIYLGKVTKWNDPRLAALNPGMKLPDQAITVVHRSDGSGTTGVFTDYLAKVSPEWKAKVGAAKSVKWPVGMGGKGNEGVTGLSKQLPGAIGYVELAYANQNHLPIALIRNVDGEFVRASVESTSEAAKGVVLPPDFRVSITNAKGKGAYPIASFTYALVYKEQPDAVKGKLLVDFLWWGIHDGQKLGQALDYAALPTPVVARVEEELRSVTAAGKAILNAR